MISETTFARGYSSFWFEYFPWLNSFSQSITKFGEQRVHSRIPDIDKPEHRAINNTIAFFQFRNANFEQEFQIEKSKDEAIKYLSRFPRNNVNTYVFSDDDKVVINQQIAYLTLRFIKELVISPFFPGCGILNNCNGDIIQNTTLTVIKAGDRNIVPADLRQLTIYCALNWLSNSDKYRIEKIELYNPRLGYSWSSDIDSFFKAITDMPKEEVFDQMVKYLVTQSEEINMK